MKNAGVVALIGRPNVGKSTLFNRLTKTRDALVANKPGLTRDRQYGVVKHDDQQFIIIDSGGLSDEQVNIEEMVAGQVWEAIDECDLALLVVDGSAGVNSSDEEIANKLRTLGKPTVVAVNKSERQDPSLIVSEFYFPGLGNPLAISAEHAERISTLLDRVIVELPENNEQPDDPQDTIDEDRIKVAVIGRPNVGKSTLINRLLGEDRVLAYDMPGTTRDTIKIPFDEDGIGYTLIDTAGVRRRSKVREVVEKFSVIKAIKALEESNVAIVVLDASEGITDQDLTLIGLAVESGRALVLAVNKWDGLDKSFREWVKEELHRRLPFVEYATIHHISALHGSGIRDLFDSVSEAYNSSVLEVGTAKVNKVLERAVIEHQPPIVKGRRIRLRFAHQGGTNPPRFIVHGNQISSVPDSYTRYLAGRFRKAFGFTGTPIHISYKSGSNPYDKTQDK